MVRKRKPRVSRLSERRAARPAAIDPNQSYSINETCAAVDCSRAGFYKAEKAGLIRVVRGLDGRPRIPGSEIIRVSRGEPLSA